MESKPKDKGKQKEPEAADSQASNPQGRAVVTTVPPTSAPSRADLAVGGAKPKAERKPKTDQELREIMKSLMDNPEAISDISDEDVIELKQRINPVGTFAPMQKTFAVESIINMKEDDMRKFMMTAMIGFIYRRLEEYVPDFVIAMEESYAAKINAITSGENMQERRDALRDECKRRSTEYKSTHIGCIRAFLDSIFLFNPDKHVRKAPAELPIDAISLIVPDAAPERPAGTAAEAPASEAGASEANAKAADLTVTRESFAESTATLRAEVEKYQNVTPTSSSDGAPASKVMRDIELATYESAETVYRQARVASGNIAQSYRLISEEMKQIQDSPMVVEKTRQRLNQLEDTRQLLQKCRTRVDGAADILGPYVAARSCLEVRNVLQIAPPADVFYHFGRYIDSHYEVLRILTNVIYQIAPGIENIVIYYDTFDELEKAKEYIRVHEAEFRADPKIIENGGVTILGPFRENRENVDFYNRNTEALRLMMEQVSRDHQLGKDLTKKKIVSAKRKNIREAGPDDAAGLERYIGARGIISQFGKKPSLSREEREQLIRAEQTRAELETPDGALAMRVLAPQLDEHGVPVDLTQSFFYAEGANVAGGANTGGSGAGTSAPARH